jgi:hypothetical protein
MPSGQVGVPLCQAGTFFTASVPDLGEEDAAFRFDSLDAGLPGLFVTSVGMCT